jgi:hypothetical protein
VEVFREITTRLCYAPANTTTIIISIIIIIIIIIIMREINLFRLQLQHLR